MKKKKIAKVGLVSLLSLTLITPATSAFGASQSSDLIERQLNQVNIVDDSLSANLILTDELVAKVDPYIKLIDNKYVITNESVIKEEISQDEFDAVVQTLNSVNIHLENIKEESEIYNEYSLEYNGETVTVLLNENGPTKFAAFAYEGKRGIDVNWNSVEIYLTKKDVGAILKGGVSGGTAALGAIIGALGGVPGAIIGAAIGAAAGTIINEYVTAVPLVIYIPFWKPIENTLVYPQ